MELNRLVQPTYLLGCSFPVISCQAENYLYLSVSQMSRAPGTVERVQDAGRLPLQEEVERLRKKNDEINTLKGSLKQTGSVCGE
jgi:hypothetical protein